jgi:hypothetical protein
MSYDESVPLAFRWIIGIKELGENADNDSEAAKKQ